MSHFELQPPLDSLNGSVYQQINTFMKQISKTLVMVYVREQIQTAVPWEGLLGYRGSAWAPPAATEVLFRELPVSHFLICVIHMVFVK